MHFVNEEWCIARVPTPKRGNRSLILDSVEHLEWKLEQSWIQCVPIYHRHARNWQRCLLGQCFSSLGRDRRKFWRLVGVLVTPHNPGSWV